MIKSKIRPLGLLLSAVLLNLAVNKPVLAYEVHVDDRPLTGYLVSFVDEVRDGHRPLARAVYQFVQDQVSSDKPIASVWIE
jgi:hypothetical protein